MAQMMNELAVGRSVTAFANSPSAVWIDFYEYAAQLLCRGNVPWLDQTAFGAFHAQAQGLLRSGVVELPLEPILRALAGSSPGLAAEMRAKPRLGYPLRVLLGSPLLRQAVIGLLQPLRAANPTRPLVLSMPSPERLLEAAYELAHGEDPVLAVTADDACTGAVYVADLLGALSDCRLDGLLMVEAGDASQLSDEWLASYEPIINKAQHYRWETGLMAAGAVHPAEPEAGFDFQIGVEPAPGCMGQRIRYGADGAPQAAAPDSGRFRYVTISPDAVPERLLGWLEQFR
jgi:hypothetical protein